MREFCLFHAREFHSGLFKAQDCDRGVCNQLLCAKAWDERNDTWPHRAQLSLASTTRFNSVGLLNQGSKE